MLHRSGTSLSRHYNGQANKIFGGVFYLVQGAHLLLLREVPLGPLSLAWWGSLTVANSYVPQAVQNTCTIHHWILPVGPTVEKGVSRLQVEFWQNSKMAACPAPWLSTTGQYTHLLVAYCVGPRLNIHTLCLLILEHLLMYHHNVNFCHIACRIAWTGYLHYYVFCLDDE